MKNLILKSLSVLALASFALTAQAIPVSGGISFAGGFTSNTGNLNTATAFSSFTNVISTGSTGTLAPAVSGLTTFNPAVLSFNGFTFGTSPGGAGSITPVLVWTGTGTNGVITTFTLNSISTVDHNPFDTVVIVGQGIFTETGFDATPGTFTFSANQAGGTFSFSLSQAALAPDGGTTALLLGLGLVGVGLSARRFKSNKA
jgi:hypothetical protein